MFESDSHICDNVTLAVLAGGQSSRMGVPKSRLRINGIPILEFLHKRLRWAGPTMLVDAPGREKPPGHELFQTVITDPVAGEGPLRGVLTALEESATGVLVAIPVDMPCMTIDALACLVSALRRSTTESLAMFRRDGQIEPLPAAFAVREARLIVREELNNRQFSLHALTTVMKTALVQAEPSWPQTLWVNLNHPADVEGYLRSSPIGVA